MFAPFPDGRGQPSSAEGGKGSFSQGSGRDKNIRLDHAYLMVPAQAYVGRFLMSFKDYPQRQKAASFNLDEVMQKLKEGGGSK